MIRRSPDRAWVLHICILAALFALQFILPPYHHTNMTRILLLACYAMGYNILFGYTGLLSLGHAMFFAAGLYGAGLGVHYLELDPASAFAFGTLCAAILSAAVGAIALRTSGVSFMIVTLMFAQVGYLSILYFNEFTRGDEGIMIPDTARRVALGSRSIDLIAPDVRYNLAWLAFGFCLLACLWVLRSPFGRILVAIRENADRAQLLGYNTYLYKLMAMTLSGAMAGMAGGGFALMFGYVGATYATIQYSILVLLWVLLGGVGTTLGPLLGSIMMFYLVETASNYTSSYNLVVGTFLVALVLFFRRGVLGWVRDRWAAWLP